MVAQLYESYDNTYRSYSSFESGAFPKELIKGNPELDMDFPSGSNLHPLDNPGNDHVPGFDFGLLIAVCPGEHFINLGLRLLLAEFLLFEPGASFFDSLSSCILPCSVLDNHGTL